MNNKEIKEINIVKSITDILKKRHGILEIWNEMKWNEMRWDEINYIMIILWD